MTKLIYIAHDTRAVDDHVDYFWSRDDALAEIAYWRGHMTASELKSSRFAIETRRIEVASDDVDPRRAALDAEDDDWLILDCNLVRWEDIE